MRPHKGGDRVTLGLAAGHGPGEAETGGEIAVNPFELNCSASLDALPGGGDLESGTRYLA